MTGYFRPAPHETRKSVRRPSIHVLVIDLDTEESRLAYRGGAGFAAARALDLTLQGFHREAVARELGVESEEVAHFVREATARYGIRTRRRGADA